MRSGATYSETPVMQLSVSWLLMVPLVCFANLGQFWFQNAERDNLLSAEFGKLVAVPHTLQDALALPLVFSLLSVLFLSRLKGIVALFRQNKIFVAIVVWALLSLAWSQNPVRGLQEWMCLAINVVFAFYLFQRFSPYQQMRLLLWLGWVCLLGSLVFVFAFPEYGLSHVDPKPYWRGIYGGKNPCGDMTAFFLTTALFAPAPTLISKVFRAVYVGLSVILVVGSGCSTAEILIAFTVIYALSVSLVRRIRFSERPLAILLAFSFTSVFAIVVVNYASELAYLFNKDPTISGRTSIWSSVIASALKHPILGYGLGGFWAGFNGESAQTLLANRWAFGGSHNGFLNVWVNFGIIGLGLVIFSLVLAFRNAWLCVVTRLSSYLSWCICIVFLTVILNIDESAILTINDLAWILYILAFIGLSDGVRRTRSELQRV
jgi:exopolysaccharide production protein ExoQ